MRRKSIGKDLSNIKDNCICLKCVGDTVLREIVQKDSFEVQCSYCDQTGQGITMNDFAKLVDEPLRANLRPGSDVPDFSSKSENIEYKQEGDTLDYLLQDVLGIEPEPAGDIIKILIDSDPAWPPDGEDPFYDELQFYIPADISDRRYHHTWRDFSEKIKHKKRFFDEESKHFLSLIFGEPGSEMTKELSIFEIGQGTPFEKVYRARKADSKEMVQKILNNPIKELGPPPASQATAGRMNPAGIPIFYGAMSLDTAIAETRPSIGNWVIVGEFKILKKLRLLNLPRIDFYFTGSIFHTDHDDRVAKSQFFKILHSLIARPIQPSDELMEYIPTQVVAEYLANVLGFDGILYSSAQVGAIRDEIEENSWTVNGKELSDEELNNCNLALFRESSLIQSDDRDCLTLSIQEDKIKIKKVTSVRYSHERDYISKEGL